MLAGLDAHGERLRRSGRLVRGSLLDRGAGDRFAADLDGIEIPGDLTRVWTDLREDLEVLGCSGDDLTSLLVHVAPLIPRELLIAAPEGEVEEADASRRAARVYLDVDGAFSPYCPAQHDRGEAMELTRWPELAIGRAPATGWTWEMTTLGLGPTRIPIELSYGLCDLHRSGAVEVVWLTSWQERANWLLEAVGVTETFRAVRLSSSTTKWSHVIAETYRDRVPFVWVDDREINPSTMSWAIEACDAPNLLVCTNGLHDLTPPIWQAIVRWLDSHVEPWNQPVTA